MAAVEDLVNLPSSLTLRQLSLPGRTLPPALPLIISCQDSWNPDTCKLDSAKEHSQDHSLKVVEDALKLLHTIHKPVAVLSICGPYRSGKSYFMSRLLGIPGVFQLGHSMRACTRGIWMATTILECEQFVTIVLDTEGIDAIGASETMAMSLLTLTTLLSSFLIYNSKKVPQKVDLDKMRCFSQLSTSLLAQRGDSMTADAMKKFFPHFLWLLRDVSLAITNKEGEKITPTEFLHTSVLASDSGEPTDLAKSLCSLFPSLECATLPVPSIKRDVIRNIMEQEGKLNPAFNTAINELIQNILQQAAPKKAIDGVSSVNGSMLTALACVYVDAINTPGALPDLEQGWQAVITLQLKEYSDTLVESYKSEMEEALRHNLPMDVKNFMRIHEETLKWKKARLAQENHRINPLHSSREEIELLQNTLELEIIKWSEPSAKGDKTITGGAVYQFCMENYDKSKELCEKLFSDLLDKSEIREKVKQAVQYSEPLSVSQDIKILMQCYHTIAVGPAAKEVLEKGVAELEQITGILKKIPGMPQSPRLIGRANDQLKLSWCPPKHNPEAVEEYVVSIKAEDGEWEEVHKTKKTRALIKGLKTEKRYDVKVVSTNSVINGDYMWGKCDTDLSTAAKAAIGALYSPALLGEAICNKCDHELSTGKQVGVYAATIPLSFLIFPVTLTVSAVLHAKRHEGDLTPVKED